MCRVSGCAPSGNQRIIIFKWKASEADLPTDAVTIENLTMTSVFLPMLEKTSANVRSVMSSVTCIAAIEHIQSSRLQSNSCQIHVALPFTGMWN